MPAWSPRDPTSGVTGLNSRRGAAGGGGTGNIVQNAGADISKTAGGNATLTLNAQGSITLNGTIGSTSNALNVALNSNLGGTGGFVAVNGAITTNGGNLGIGSAATAATGIVTSYAKQLLQQQSTRRCATR